MKADYFAGMENFNMNKIRKKLFTSSKFNLYSKDETSHLFSKDLLLLY